MDYDSDLHHRRSIRLDGYDYAQAGAYFITICTQHRRCFFGDISDGDIHLTDAGAMVQSVWDAIPTHYPNIGIDAFMVMPNHIHGIVIIRPETPTVGAPPRARPSDSGQARVPAPTSNETANDRVEMSLSDLVHRFKTLTTKRYVDGVKQAAWPEFPARLWQRNYYEHIIRNEPDLSRIREYIVNNPLQWHLDRENPAVASL